MTHIQRLAIAAAAVATAVIGFNFISGLSVGAPAPTTAPSAAIASLPARGLPGARGGPAGEYGWDGRPGTRTGMHRVVPDGDVFREATAMGFAAGPDCFGQEDRQTTPVRVAGLDGVMAEPYEPAVGFNQVGDEITRGYALAVGDRTLCVFLTWHPTTTEDELNSAVNILTTIRAQPLGPDGIRITFTLPDGWDTG